MTRRIDFGYDPTMPDLSESLVALESHLVDHLLDFEDLDAAWPKGRTAVERARIGREREEALSEIATLRNRIAGGRAATLADAAVQLRRLVVMADEEPRPHVLLASPDARGLVVSVLAVTVRRGRFGH